MSELRKDLVSGRWVIVSADGSKRSHHLGDSRGADQERDGDDIPSYEQKCPFCKGNEHMTQPEINVVKAQKDSDASDWIVRVVPSNQPALKPVGEPVVRRHHIHQYISGVGSHEIIVETPQHNIEPYDQPLDRFAAVIETYRDRMLILESDRRFEYVSVFRTHGEPVDAQLAHPHSEIIAVPLVPVAVQEELKQSRDYHEFSSRCVMCDLIRDELSAGIRIIMADDEFVAITPYAARVPFETWIVPRRHNSAFTAVTDAEAKELARSLARILLVLAEDLGDPAYTYHIHTAPARTTGLEYYHWHLELIPKLGVMTGLESSTGVPVNPATPEENAAFLNRRLKVT